MNGGLATGSVTGTESASPSSSTSFEQPSADLTDEEFRWITEAYADSEFGVGEAMVEDSSSTFHEHMRLHGVNLSPYSAGDLAFSSSEPPEVYRDLSSWRDFDTLRTCRRYECRVIPHLRKLQLIYNPVVHTSLPVLLPV